LIRPLLCVGALLLFSAQAAYAAPTVWASGPNNLTFTKGLFVDVTDPANQDRITNNVWITRGDSNGIFNAKLETAWNDADPPTSPLDTEWAVDTGHVGAITNSFTFGGINDGATHHSSLAFTDWEEAYASTGDVLLTSILNHPAVLHLISEDIFIDVMFTDWATGARQGPSGGGFTYIRAVSPTAIPEPASLALLALGVAACVTARRSSRRAV